MPMMNWPPAVGLAFGDAFHLGRVELVLAVFTLRDHPVSQHERIGKGCLHICFPGYFPANVAP